jgi:hypothetical protein
MNKKTGEQIDRLVALQKNKLTTSTNNRRHFKRTRIMIIMIGSIRK